MNDKALEIRRAYLEAQLNKVLDEQALRDAFGSADDYEEGTVLVFEKQFQHGGRVYTYSAIKSPDNSDWYISSRTGDHYRDHEGFMHFLFGGTVPVTNIWRVTQMEALF